MENHCGVSCCTEAVASLRENGWGQGWSLWNWRFIAKSFRSFWMLVSPIGESGPSTTVAFIFPESVLDMVGPMSPFVVILEKIAGTKTQEIGETMEKKGNFTILAFVARDGFRGGLPFLRNLTGFCFWFCSSLTYIESPESVSLFCWGVLWVSNCRWRSISENRRSGNDVNLQWFMRARVGRWRMWSQDS